MNVSPLEKVSSFHSEGQASKERSTISGRWIGWLIKRQADKEPRRLDAAKRKDSFRCCANQF
ncbi:unnamed protein product [Musa acuminata subsp. burmannicoides]